MGFSDTDTGKTITLIAKLTPFGRQSLLSSNSNLITHFSAGDTDANYNAEMSLDNGETLATGGNIGINNSISNGVVDTAFRSNVLADRVGSVRKLVEPSSRRITVNESFLGEATIMGDTGFTHDIIDRTDITTDSLVNLFHPLGLPINETDKLIFSSVTSANGGFADTALSGVNQDKILLIGIDNDLYGEKLDGKHIKLDVDVSGTGYTMYSTFQKTLTSAAKQDGRTKETAVDTAIIGNNIAFLFSDSIKKPNGDVSKSWATGFGQAKPFTQGKKSQFNLKADTNNSLVADEVVGIAYLDKGVIAITHPTLVDSFAMSATSGTVATYNHTATRVTQNILCTMNPGEFTVTNNATYTSNREKIRISELGLHDVAGNLIAVSKLDKQLVKGGNQFVAFTVKLEV